MAIEIVIGFDKDKKEFRAYEPNTDTLLITTSLGETFLKLSEFLLQQNMIASDILSAQDITYHIDSPTFIAMVESNAALLKRLQTGPSGFQVSQGRFGQSPNQLAATSQSAKNKKFGEASKKYKTNKGGFFSKTSFIRSSKKFGK